MDVKAQRIYVFPVEEEVHFSAHLVWRIVRVSSRWSSGLTTTTVWMDDLEVVW
jgi:hypothetical protein